MSPLYHPESMTACQSRDSKPSETYFISIRARTLAPQIMYARRFRLAPEGRRMIAHGVSRGSGVWTFFSRIQTNQRRLPMKTNVVPQRMEMSTKRLFHYKQEMSHDCRVFRGNRGFVLEIPELPTIKRNLRV